MRPPYLAILLPLLLAACSNGMPPGTPPEVASAIKPPSEQAPFLEAQANGVQIYECTLKPDASYEWVFKAPEAALTDRQGEPVGKHYAGPTWEAEDGSSVVGTVTARDPGPDPTAIPWLLLSVKSRSGLGVLTGTLTIQRVATHGGLPPDSPCGVGSVNRQARVPYTATYFFYH